MLALLSVWIGLLSLLLALTMVVYRPAFTDVTVVLVLYFGVPGGLCLAGLTLWAHRKEKTPDSGLSAQRIQTKVAIALGLAAAALVYALIIFAHCVE